MRVRSWIGVFLLAVMSIGIVGPRGARGCELRNRAAAARLVGTVDDMLSRGVARAVNDLLASGAVESAHDHRDAAEGPADPAVLTNCATSIAALPAHEARAIASDAHRGAFDDVTGFAASHDPPPPFHPPRLS
ncbi:MAG TPA: hypothetical protein VFT96_10580 [Gemmatimonadaceae bacterium]|nr:hypothetical protein [Gemmatimonadaceae bacterium]